MLQKFVNYQNESCDCRRLYGLYQQAVTGILYGKAKGAISILSPQTMRLAKGCADAEDVGKSETKYLRMAKSTAMISVRNRKQRIRSASDGVGPAALSKVRP